MRGAFSLVELSIVLVILGLLVGGILTGQSLIRAAELRSVTAQYNTFRTASMTFREKYFAIAGDINNATDFWGSKGGNGEDDTCYAVVATGAATCNGDGDGYVADNGSSTVKTEFAERFLFWQHLANAGLIEGTYTGVTDSSTSAYEVTAGVNAPASKISPAFWGVHFPANGDETSNTFAYPLGVIYSLRTLIGSSTAMSPLYAEEVWNIDKKIDDGKPGMGIVMTHKNSSSAAPGCATTDDASTAEYALTYTDNTCHLRMFGR